MGASERHSLPAVAFDLVGSVLLALRWTVGGWGGPTAFTLALFVRRRPPLIRGFVLLQAVALLGSVGGGGQYSWAGGDGGGGVTRERWKMGTPTAGRPWGDIMSLIIFRCFELYFCDSSESLVNYMSPTGKCSVLVGEKHHQAIFIVRGGTLGDSAIKDLATTSEKLLHFVADRYSLGVKVVPIE